MSKSELVDLTLHRHALTAKAILVSDDGDKEKAQWLPLSQVEVEPLKDVTVIVTCPVWLAKEKGFV